MSWLVKPAEALTGEIHVPGDKSVTHRAYLLGAMAEGTTVISSPLRAEDTDNTLRAVEALGVAVYDTGDQVKITSSGPASFQEPADVVDLGNSGTGVRLLSGVLAGSPVYAVLTGDESLKGRPMGRIIEPLRLMGVSVDGRGQGKYLPLSIRGGNIKAITYNSPVASAQVKSCVILAGLQAEGTTLFTEPALSRDHTERMLAGMGAPLSRDGDALVIQGGNHLHARDLTVPGDVSSAAFFLVAAAILDGSELTIRNVGVNPTRTGIIEMLKAMGADLDVRLLDDLGEPRADITVRGGRQLSGIDVPEEWIPAIIDELPVAAVAASFADGVTRIRGAAELRVKESDRIATTVKMLKAAGVKVDETEDGMDIYGTDTVKAARYQSHGDHRIAMSSAVLSLRGDDSGSVSGTACVDTSFPSFFNLLATVTGGAISLEKE
jgi:3-phosphoshikimate 1-carboxyvinyltransferase